MNKAFAWCARNLDGVSMYIFLFLLCWIRIRKKIMKKLEYEIHYTFLATVILATNLKSDLVPGIAKPANPHSFNCPINIYDTVIRYE